MKNLLLLLLFCITSVAQAGTADLSLQVDFGDTSDLRPGQRGTFSMIFSNAGPDMAGADSTLEYPVQAVAGAYFGEGLFTSIEIMPTDADSLCRISLGFLDPAPGGPSYILSVAAPPLAAGSSITCEGAYQVDYSLRTETQNWNIRSISDTDPDPSDNQVQVVFGVSPQQVNALGFTGLSVLVILAALTGIISLSLRTRIYR